MVSRTHSVHSSSVGNHVGFWGQYSGHYEHWRFQDGFIKGWEDAYAFFSFDIGSAVSEIGFKEQWAKRRVAAHAQHKGPSKNIWEYGTNVIYNLLHLLTQTS